MSLVPSSTTSSTELLMLPSPSPSTLSSASCSPFPTLSPATQLPPPSPSLQCRHPLTPAHTTAPLYNEKLSERLQTHDLEACHETSLQRTLPPKSGANFAWSRWATEDVATPALVPALVMQALATGILDATTYADFKTFASNQTGNCILLTLSAVGTAKILLLLTGVSLASFLGSAFIFGHLGHWLGVRRRIWLLCTTACQIVFLILATVFLSPHGPVATRLGGTHEWVILFLFASMSGGQVAMARQSSCAELPTAPMTSTFVDFVADQYLFRSWSDERATPRNRRVYYVVAMIGGSFLGATLHRYTSSWIVVAVTTGLKGLVLLLLATARADLRS